MHEKYMEKAYNEAYKAYKIKEMPVGAVIVCNNKIIAKGYNKRELKRNSIMHAEIIAIDKACKKLKSWRLNDCTIYVTMEPCLMCLGAIVESRIPKIVYGVKNNKYNEINKNIIIKNNIEVIEKVLEEKIKNITHLFFNNIRNR